MNNIEPQLNILFLNACIFACTGNRKGRGVYRKKIICVEREREMISPLRLLSWVWRKQKEE